MTIANFIKKKDYEKIVYVLRRHWITFIPIVLFFLFLLLIPVIIYYFLNIAVMAWQENEIIYPLLVLFGGIYYLVTLAFFSFRFVEFYLDVGIVTNDRVLDVEQLGLFSRSISELDLFRIQDVSTEVHGVLATIFQFGDVVIKTASSNAHIIFRNVSNPNEIRENLIRLSHEDRKYHMGLDDNE
jgi:membrane protein YdbS with pleckstrin-like domain